MKEYELTVLIRPDREVELDKSLGVVKKLVSDNGGKLLSEDKKRAEERGEASSDSEA